MKGRNPTAAEKRFMSAMANTGCIVCRLFYEESTPAAIHHCDGKTKEGAHFNVLPLCGNHHQVPDTQKPKRWISRHGDSKTAFEREYGSEEDLRKKAIELI